MLAGTSEDFSKCEKVLVPPKAEKAKRREETLLEKVQTQVRLERQEMGHVEQISRHEHDLGTAEKDATGSAFEAPRAIKPASRTIKKANFARSVLHKGEPREQTNKQKFRKVRLTSRRAKCACKIDGNVRLRQISGVAKRTQQRLTLNGKEDANSLSAVGRV